MMRKLLMIAFALICYIPFSQAGILDDWLTNLWRGQKPEPPTIKVLIVHDQPGVVLEVKGKYKIYDPHQNNYLSTRFIGKRKFIQALQDGLKWGEEFPGVHQLKIVPDDKNTTTIVDGIEYRGTIYVYDIGGTISVVNEVDIEDYLASILEPQFDENLSPETFAAIAITARTNAYYQAMNPKNTYWAVDAGSVEYEGYAVTKRATAVDKALQATKYMVLVLPNDQTKKNETFPAQWGSTTGGKVPKENAVFSRISLFQAEDLAKAGEHAAQILAKAFPNAQIVLMYSANK